MCALRRTGGSSGALAPGVFLPSLRQSFNLFKIGVEQFLLDKNIDWAVFGAVALLEFIYRVDQSLFLD